MKFQIVYSERALEDLRNIYRYVAVDLLAPEAAKNLSNRLMTKIEALDQMPDRNPLYEKEPWHSRGLRKLIADHFIVFYLPLKQQSQVLILAVLYGKRDITKILADIKKS